MRRLLQLLRQRRDTTLLSAALLLLVLALLRPTLPVQRDIYTYLLVVDITQSMNSEDMQLAGQPASRIAWTRHLMHDAIAAMPYGSRVGVSLFAGVMVSTIFHPIEVCANFDAIQDSVAHLEWREAWHGNSRLQFGMLSTAAALKVSAGTSPRPFQKWTRTIKCWATGPTTHTNSNRASLRSPTRRAASAMTASPPRTTNAISRY